MLLRSAALALALLLVGCGEPPLAGQGKPTFDREALTGQLEAVAKRVGPARLGVAVQDLTTSQVFSFNGDQRFPMQSVFKAPLGAAVLAEVDAGRLKLDQAITIKDVDLSPTYSPVADLWPGRDTYTVGELLDRSTGGSDNTAADVLMKQVGGPGAVTAWLQGRKVLGVRVDRYERQLQPEILGMPSFRAEWREPAAYIHALQAVPEDARRRAVQAYLSDPRDTATPLGAVRFLEALNQGELLSPASTQRLLTIMTQPQTGQGRLYAALPDGASLAHKTGTARTDLGMNPATNDIGIFTLKNGHRFAVAVFLSGSTLDDVGRDEVIAEVGRIVMKTAK